MDGRVASHFMFHAQQHAVQCMNIYCMKIIPYKTIYRRLKFIRVEHWNIWFRWNSLTLRCILLYEYACKPVRWEVVEKSFKWKRHQFILLYEQINKYGWPVSLHVFLRDVRMACSDAADGTTVNWSRVPRYVYLHRFFLLQRSSEWICSTSQTNLALEMNMCVNQSLGVQVLDPNVRREKMINCGGLLFKQSCNIVS